MLRYAGVLGSAGVIAERLPARNVYKCDACGKRDIWGNGFVWLGSLLLEENEPDALIHACSDECRAVCEEKLRTGEWVQPKYRMRGYSVRRVSDGKGYGIFSHDHQ